MAKKYTEEQLNRLDKDMLVTLFLGLQDQLEQVNKNLDLLTEQVSLMNQRMYGRTSEKNLVSEIDGQAKLMVVDGELTAVFNEAEIYLSDPFEELSEDDVFPQMKKHTARPQGKREKDLSGFPCRIEMHELTEEELKDIFGTMKYKRLPDEVYKRLIYRPATQEVVEHHVAVYAGDDNQTIVKADRPKDLIRGSIVTPSLQAAILNGKYVNAIPLYRLEQDFLRNDVHISRQTMANWTIRVAEEYLSLLYEYMHRKLYEHHVLQADETPLLVNKDGRGAGSKSYMWVYRTGEMNPKEPIILYEYQKTRKADHPKNFLKNFKGVLVTDGYQVYHTLSDSQEDLAVAGCWSHARRRFAEIVKMLKDKKQARNTLAYAALEQIKAIYKVEESLKYLSSEEREIRRHLSVEPLVESFFAWLKAHQFDIPEKSATAKGIQYCLNQEKYLRYFLQDGEVPIDNNASERAIRGFCIGKKNWVMIDTIHGAKACAIIYSIAETAKANHLRTYHYFEYLLTEIPKHMDDKDTSFLENLAPWSDKLPDSCYFIKQ